MIGRRGWSRRAGVQDMVMNYLKKQCSVQTNGGSNTNEYLKTVMMGSTTLSRSGGDRDMNEPCLSSPT